METNHMTTELIQLTEAIRAMIHSSNRISKSPKYWYPLSMATYGIEEVSEATQSMCAFRTTMCDKTQKFEHQFQEYQESEDAIMVNSGSSADLLLSFLLKEVDPNDDRDEVLIPAVTWPTQIWSVMMAGFRVRLVDVDPLSLNVDLQDLESKISSRTRAIFVVHLMGNPCDMRTITALAAKHDLAIMEDCCEALGARFADIKVGNFGLGGTFSFFFSHHMTTMEGGMVVCRNDAIGDRLRIMRAHGWTRNVKYKMGKSHPDIDPRYAFVNWGFNMRPTELQAGFGIHQLKRLPTFNRIRDELAAKFFAFVRGTPWLETPCVLADAKPSWMGLPVMVSKDAPFSAGQLMAFLESEGVETRPVVTGNIARHPVAARFKDEFSGSFHGADEVHFRGFYLGLSPVQEPGSIDRLIECFNRFLKSI